MEPLKQERKYVVAVGLLVLLALGAFAWKYYLERVACFDSAFFSWQMLNERSPVSVLGRYGSWLAQLLPVALIRLDAPLEMVLRAYSVSFILLHLIVFLLLAVVLREGRAAMALPICLTAGFHYMFYYGISELYQGLVLSLLLWALLHRLFRAEGRMARVAWFSAALLLNIWISSYHQLLVFPLLFILGVELAKEGRWMQRQWWVAVALLLGWYVLRINVFTESGYENSRLITMGEVWASVLHIHTFSSTKYLVGVVAKFKAFHLLCLAVAALALWRKAWWRLAWTVGFSMGFLCLALIVDRDSRSPIINENYYPVVAFFWAVAFADLARGAQWGKLRPAYWLLPLICGLGLLQIHQAHYRLSAKVAYSYRVASFNAQHGAAKVVVNRDSYPWAYTIGHWAEGFTSTLVTSVHGPRSAATAFVPDEGSDLAPLMADPLQFLGPSWEPKWFGIQNLNLRYIQLPDTKGYVAINTPDHGFEYARLRFGVPSVPVRLVPDRFTVIPVTIYNPTGSNMPSCDSLGRPLRFHYTLTPADGGRPIEGETFSPMETDIPPQAGYDQGIVIERPAKAGRYTVTLACEGTAMNTRFEVMADHWPW